MSEKSRFRRSFNKWYGKLAETLLKSERQHLYHIYWFLWRQLGLENSPWVRCKNLGLFLNALYADKKILFSIEAVYSYILRCYYLKNQKHFLNFYLPFLYLDSISKIFRNKMTLIADGILNLRTPKNVVSWMCKNSCFILFWECRKLNPNLENVKKNWENIFTFWDKGIWKDCNK